MLIFSTFTQYQITSSTTRSKMGLLVRIETIAHVEAIPGTDDLDMVTLEDSRARVVTNHNEYKIGNTVVFFENDAALPADDARYTSLREQNLYMWHDKNGNVLNQVIRIRPVKINDIISQGGVMPVSLFPELAAVMNGEDEDDILHVRKFHELDEEMRKNI